MQRVLVLAAGIGLAIFPASGETGPEFEVASVKVSTTAPFAGGRPMPDRIAEMIGFSGGPGGKDPGRFTCTGVSLKILLVRAYGMRSYQISTPAWMETERYDIAAIYPPETKMEDFRLMFQKLLTERFHIVLHRESKEMQRFNLTVAKGGHKLLPPEVIQDYKDDPEGRAARQKDALERIAKARGGGQGSLSWMHESRATTAKLAGWLEGMLGKPVTDMTGLSGEFSYSMRWSPDDAPATENSLPTIFEAVQQQLGLKLEQAKGPVEILVIDKAENVPVEN